MKIKKIAIFRCGVFFLLLLHVFCGTGCTPLQPALPLTKETADEVWDRYLALKQPQEKPTAITASVRYTLPDQKGHRVMLTLWGNGKPPYRADVSAGFNTVIARFFEAPGSFAVHIPSENTLYFHEGKEMPKISIGRPLPLSPDDLIALLMGNYPAVFGVLGSNPEALPHGDIRYHLPADPGVMGDATLTLTPQGHPVAWEGQENGWKITIEYKKPTLADSLPERLVMSQADGYSAILLIKKRDYPSVPYADAELSLDIPPDTKVKRMP